ncbi:MAG: hypothetical protein AAF628_08400 [Planctomycetota bacterium]
MSGSPRLLIDADIAAFKAVTSPKDNPFADPMEAAAEYFSAYIHKAVQATRPGSCIEVCFSDPAFNWRKEFEPSYKENRKGVEKPPMLDPFKAAMKKAWSGRVLRWLEADDVMGILATSNDGHDDIIVSEDKDMRTIPAKVYNPAKPELGVLEITPTQANQFHMWQTVVGDATDGYPGCPGIGPGCEYSSSPFGVDIKEGAKSFGWAHDLLSIEDPLELWDAVLDAYASQGRTEADAIHQARLASICRRTNWDSDKQRVRLWNPTHLFY